MLWHRAWEPHISSRFDTGAARASTIRPMSIIGAAVGIGAQDTRCRQGPDRLQACGLMARLADEPHGVSWGGTVREDTGVDVVYASARFCERLARKVYDALQDNPRIGVVGGDHSCAIGTWSGVHQAIAGSGPLGLIWIDAHMDSHTPDTSPSGALHGMPLACLLGHGPEALTGLGVSGPKLAPQHVCLIGVRSFEPAEAALLQKLGVRVLDMDQIRRHGLARVMDDALAYVQKNTAGFGISIDLDAIDPRDAPGVGSPVGAGICGKDLAESLANMGRHPGLLGLEIAEFNPDKDVNNRTAKLVIDLLAATVGLRG